MQEVIDYIKSHPELSYCKIGSKFNKTTGQIRHIAKKAKITRGKGSTSKFRDEWKVNKDYFKKINENSAYILGFILADGCISGEKNRHRLVIEILKKDIEILNFIKKEIAPKNNIIERTTLSVKGKIQERVCLQISSHTLIKDLAKLGIVPAKTGKEVLPDIPKKYFYDFLRGYFDGDGCFYYKKRKRIINGKEYIVIDNTFKITGKEKLIFEQLQQKLKMGSVLKTTFKDRYYYNYQISNKVDIKELFKKMYNGNFCLDRKFLKIRKVGYV